jgi:hypothetical protein
MTRAECQDALVDRPLDTSADADGAQIEVYRRMTGSERLAAAFRLIRLARRTTVSGIRARHPEYDDEQVRLAYARLVLGDDLTRAAWPDRELVAP